MLRFRKSLMVILIEMISWGFAILLIWYWTCPESSSLIYPLLTLLSFQNQMWRWIYGGLERCFPPPLLYFIPYVCKIKTFVELQLHPLSLFLYFQNISAIKHFPFLNPPPAQKRFTSSVHRPFSYNLLLADISPSSEKYSKIRFHFPAQSTQLFLYA